MPASRRPGRFRGAVVVLTGASSGIGRAAALAFAREGADLVLAARGRRGLEDTARLCRMQGACVLALPTDVTVPGEVRRLADSALEAFGRIDVWINNAGVGAVGWFEEVPLEAHRRVIDTDLLGPLNGAAAVLPHFIRQGRGVMINTVSIGAWVAPPLAAAYTAAKFGLRGLTEALRQDMRRFPGIHVCGLYPTFVDTPGLRHGANYSGRRIDPVSPMQRPETVAARMLDLAARPRAVALVGLSTWLGRLAYAHAPGTVGALLARAMGGALAAAGPERRHDGNLFAPPDDPPRRSDGFNRRAAARLAPLAVPLAMAAGAVALARRGAAAR
ncbi:MAG TPA: SDR family oxidoreductase [Azospirillaceae bacterium]|nr:SDR family oxidoreductase [Azospirillaceae bacterium]